MFQINELGDDIEHQKQYMLEQMDAAKNDLITRLEFIWMAKNGMFDTSEEIKVEEWLKPLTQ